VQGSSAPQPSGGAAAFIAALATEEHAPLLAELLTRQSDARQQVPAGWVLWFAGLQPMGHVPPARARWMLAHLSGSVLSASGLHWRGADALSFTKRSNIVQDMLLQARREGQLTGWRDERFSFWHADCERPGSREHAYLEVERAGFRFLGMLSHAVHVNGFSADGRLWTARRANDKATDPGMLDNLAAGGLPCGESLDECLWRELHEEAGITPGPGLTPTAAGWVRTSRQEPQGWHDEVLHVYNLNLPEPVLPANQDGEVSEFMCLCATEVLSRIAAGEYTADALHSLVQGLQQPTIAAL
jgi:8-oxo-dGTP pyrophosphatase MutT (NUDIX family)